MVKKEGIIKGRHDAGGHFKRVKKRDGAEGLLKGGMMQEDVTKGRDDAGGHYKREG